MSHARLAFLLALALALAGCSPAADRWSADRPNGQPRWLPCMRGDVLCTRP